VIKKNRKDLFKKNRNDLFREKNNNLENIGRHLENEADNLYNII